MNSERPPGRLLVPRLIWEECPAPKYGPYTQKRDHTIIAGFVVHKWHGLPLPFFCLRPVEAPLSYVIPPRLLSLALMLHPRAQRGGHSLCKWVSNGACLWPMGRGEADDSKLLDWFSSLRSLLTDNSNVPEGDIELPLLADTQRGSDGHQVAN